MIDWAFFLIGLLAPLCAVLAWMWHDAEQECRRLRIRAQEVELWCELQDEELDAVRRRLEAAERRHATLQTLHAEKTRLLLARNYPIIEAHVIARRGAKN